MDAVCGWNQGEPFLWNDAEILQRLGREATEFDGAGLMHDWLRDGLARAASEIDPDACAFIAVAKDGESWTCGRLRRGAACRWQCGATVQGKNGGGEKYGCCWECWHGVNLRGFGSQVKREWEYSELMRYFAFLLFLFFCVGARSAERPNLRMRVDR